MSEGNVVEINQVSFSFRQDGGQIPILDRLNLHAGSGEFVTIIGPSGSGKSTLLHLIGGIIRPDSGSIHFNERDVTGQTGLTGFMPQEHALFPWRTIEQNVIIAQEIAGIPRKEALHRARSWLPKIGLAGYEQAYPYMLSGGMKQRVAFLRALLSNKPTLLLDEPFGSLDALTRLDMQQWLLRMWEADKRTVFLVTHSIEEALLLSDRIYIFSAKPARILEEIKVPFTRPRQQKPLADPTFLELREHIYGRLRP